MASTDKSYSFPAEYMGFLREFQSLMKKHPQAASRFALADIGDGAGQLIADIPTPAFECRRTEWGLVCKKVIE